MPAADLDPARELYPGFMQDKPTPDAAPLPYRNPSELPLPAWFDREQWPHFAAGNLVNAVYRCQRCGTCLTTDPCTRMMHGDGSEVFTPRGTIGIIRAVLEGQMAVHDLPQAAIDAVNLCIYCNNCAHVCMVNQAWVNGLAQEPNIPAADLFDAFRQTLADQGVPGVKGARLSPPPGGWPRRQRKPLGTPPGQP